jgi:hypothetical protein
LSPTLGAAFDGGENCVGVGGPCEALRLTIVLLDETVDGCLYIGDRVAPARSAARSSPRRRDADDFGYHHAAPVRRSERRFLLRHGDRSAMSCPRGAIREGRLLSRKRPSMPSCAKRFCRRKTQVFDLPVRRMISFVPTPAADRRTARRSRLVMRAFAQHCGLSRWPGASCDRGRTFEGNPRAHAPDSHAKTGSPETGLKRQILSGKRPGAGLGFGVG